jgi:hypothetical protein
MNLTDTDRDVLDFEESWWTRPGAKATAIRQRLRMSPTSYYRRLDALVDNAEALQHAPLLVRRLRRRRLERRKGRFETAPKRLHPRR